MATVRDVSCWLDRFAPPGLAEAWDNVGLLWGDPGAEVGRVMTCLTVTNRTALEAVHERAELPGEPLERARAGLVRAHLERVLPAHLEQGPDLPQRAGHPELVVHCRLYSGGAASSTAASEPASLHCSSPPPGERQGEGARPEGA